MAEISDLIWAGGGAGVAAGAPKVISSLFQFYRWLNGRKPSNAERVDDDYDKVTVVGDDAIVVYKPVVNIYNDRDTAPSVRRIIDPLLMKGIDTLSIDQNDQTIQRVSEDEVPQFFPPATTSQERVVVNDSIRQGHFWVQSLAFKTGNKWRLVDRDRTVYSVAMKDVDFQRQVDTNQVAFSKDDVLVCDLRTIQWDDEGDIRSEYEVVQVIRHDPYVQSRLDLSRLDLS